MKLFWHSLCFCFPLVWDLGSSPKWFNPGSRRIGSSGRKENLLEEGSLLVAAIPFLLITLLLILGAAKITLASHRRIAMQSRLDICTSRLLEHRKLTLKRLEDPNRILTLTENGVLMARSMKAFTGPAGALLSTLGERALVQLNQKTALWQDVLVKQLHLRERTLGKICGPTPYSNGLAYCEIQPSLPQLLYRKNSYFPDIKSTLKIRLNWNHRGTFQCIGLRLVSSLRLTLEGKKVYEE